MICLGARVVAGSYTDLLIDEGDGLGGKEEGYGGKAVVEGLFMYYGSSCAHLYPEDVDLCLNNGTF